MSEVKNQRDVQLTITREKAIQVYNSLVALTNQVNDAGNPVISSAWIAFSKSMANLEPIAKEYDTFLKPLKEKLKALTSVEAADSENTAKSKKKAPALSEEELEIKRKELDDEITAYLAEEVSIKVRQISLEKIQNERHNAFLMKPLWDIILIED